MYRTDLAELIKTTIDASSPESWPGGLVLGSSISSDDPNFVSVEVALDPYTDAKILTPGIFIVPGNKEFRESNSRKRNNTTANTVLTFVTVCLSARLKESDPGTDEEEELRERERYFDLVEKTVWSKWMKLKDDLDKFLYIYDWSSNGLKVESVDTEPPDELSLDARYFLETTVLGYAGC